MYRLSMRLKNGKWGRYALISGSCLFITLFILFPGSMAQALQARNTVTAAPAGVTSTVSNTPTPTPEPQGEVGANAGLVCGAGILVLIIVAGLIWSTRWMQLRGQSRMDEAE